jgi:hypothetical protein
MRGVRASTHGRGGGDAGLGRPGRDGDARPLQARCAVPGALPELRGCRLERLRRQGPGQHRARPHRRVVLPRVDFTPDLRTN